MHPSIDGHLALLYILVTVTNDEEISLPYGAFLPFGYLPSSEVAGSYSNSIGNCLRSTLFSRSAVLLYFTTNGVPEFFFLRILAALVISCLLDMIHSKRCEVKLVVVLGYLSL